MEKVNYDNKTKAELIKIIENQAVTIENLSLNNQNLNAKGTDLEKVMKLTNKFLTNVSRLQAAHEQATALFNDIKTDVVEQLTPIYQNNQPKR